MSLDRTRPATKRSLDAALIVGAISALVAIVLLTAARADGGAGDGAIRVAKPAVTLILAARRDGRKLTPISSGSGTIVSSDGSILTNYHVVGDASSRELHELFIVARYRGPGQDPQFVCAGRPRFGMLKPALDLALVKCDLDMNLRPYAPTDWPAVPIGRSEEMIPGEPIIVLGYPNVGATQLQSTRGLLSGWMAEDSGSSLRAYMKTDAAIFQGNSGGAALDEAGELIGVPTAYRVTTAEAGQIVVSAGKVGLIRPIEHARDLLAIAAAGWEPGPDNVVRPADAKPATAPPVGVLISSRVVDSTSGKPVAGAFVVVFRPGVRRGDVDIEELESQALTWGQTTAAGEFQLEKRLTRGNSYTVAVMTRGYEPLVAESGLVVAADAPSQLDPWEIIRIDRR